MNLTAALYGLSTSIDYSTDSTSKWSQNISFSEYLKISLRDEPCKKEKFQSTGIHGTGSIDLISGDINLTNIEADLYSIIKNKNDFTRDIPYKFEQSVRVNASYYDYVLIDTSPSASSIINALLVMSSDYFIAPVSPSFFSLQAVDNLSTIFQNWIALLGEYRITQGQRNGLSFNVKFL
jgi:cellulose biosynthesis protein BcsQ